MDDLQKLLAFLDISYYEVKSSSLKKIIVKYYPKYQKYLSLSNCPIIANVFLDLNMQIKTNDLKIYNNYLKILNKMLLKDTNNYKTINLNKIVSKNINELKKIIIVE